LDKYLLRPELSLISCNILPGITAHCKVLLEVEWNEIFGMPKVERILRVYHKTDVLFLRGFHLETFSLWLGYGNREF
jgi:hypothetical protein